MPKKYIKASSNIFYELASLSRDVEITQACLFKRNSYNLYQIACII